MIKLINLIIVCALALVSQCSLAMDANTAVGYWKTIDDVSGKTKAIIRIWEGKNRQLYGQITQTYPEPGEHELCVACQDERHNQPILGMVILTSLKPSKNSIKAWSDGQILDPKSGKIYHCNVQVTNHGQALSVRGYIGMPLFGRSQTWVRTEGPQG